MKILHKTDQDFKQNEPGGFLKSTRFLLYFLVIFVGAAGLVSCGSKGEKRSKDDRLLAKVYDKPLYLSDMDGMIPEGMSSEDSALIINAFVRSWVREAALLREAERNIPSGLDIDKLVQDYRASLIKHNYENIAVDKLLDSTVTQNQLAAFYEKNKEQYQLETPIIRCYFIKAPRNAPQLSRAQEWWNGNTAADSTALANWCNANAVIHHLQSNIWYKVEDIGAYMPQGSLTVDNVKTRRDFVQRDENFIYFFKVLELVSKKEIAPLSYIEDQARKVILHKRKTQLLEELKDKIYNEAMNKKQVTIFE